jgi:hypothetical protein
MEKENWKTLRPPVNTLQRQTTPKRRIFDRRNQCPAEKILLGMNETNAEKLCTGITRLRL